MSTHMKMWRSFGFQSVPFFAFKDRRVAYRGFSSTFASTKQYQYPYPDWVFTGPLKCGLDAVAVPVIHTYHTQYEDYIRYITRHSCQQKHGQIHCEII